MMTMVIRDLQHVIELLRVQSILALPCSLTLTVGSAQCEWCHIAKGDYTEPKTQQGTLTANQPLELLCIDFTKADPSKGWEREHPCSHRCLFKIQPSLRNIKSKGINCCQIAG